MLWYEKYRPTELDDYVWTDESTKDMLIKWINDPLDYPHLLLAGPTGTGKTTLAMIIRGMLKLGPDAKFIQASVKNGVEVMRETVINFCEAGGFGELKIVIFDEADRLSPQAQDIMRNVMDRYKDDVRFIFTCNNLSKIEEPVQGRMWVVQIDALNNDEFVDRLIEIAIAEDVDLTEEGAEARLEEIVAEYYPNLRTAISALQRSFLGGSLTNAKVEKLAAEWEGEMLSLFDNFDMNRARTLVAGMRQDEYEDAYRVLYSEAAMFEENHGEAILIIAEHLYRHSHAGLPDITLAACLVKLGELNDG